MRQTLHALLIACVLTGSAAPAAACPLCKAANESTQDGEPNTKPQAYMYSILFMISMPATLLGAFGFAFWRMSRQTADTLEVGDDASA